MEMKFLYTILENGKSSIKTQACSEGSLLVSSHGRRQEGKRRQATELTAQALSKWSLIHS